MSSCGRILSCTSASQSPKNETSSYSSTLAKILIVVSLLLGAATLISYGMGIRSFAVIIPSAIAGGGGVLGVIIEVIHAVIDKKTKKPPVSTPPLESSPQASTELEIKPSSTPDNAPVETKQGQNEGVPSLPRLIEALKNHNFPFATMCVKNGTSLDSKIEEKSLIQWVIDQNDVDIAGWLILQQKQKIINERIGGLTIVNYAASKNYADSRADLVHTTMVGFLVGQGFPVTSEKFSDMTILHWAIHYASPKLLQLLLAKGGNTFENETDKEGHTPLQLCAKMQQRPKEVIAKMTSILLQHASVKEKEAFLVFAEQQSKLHVTPEVKQENEISKIDITSLIESINAQNRAEVITFLRSRSDFKLRGLDKKTQLAARSLLLSTDASDQTSMDYATLFIERADISLLREPDTQGETPFGQLLKQEKLAVAALFLKKSRAFLEDTIENNSLIIWIVDKDNLKLAKWIVDQEKENTATIEGNLLVHAVFKFNYKLVTSLLEHGCRITAAKQHDLTILHWVIRCAPIKLLQLLLEKGGNLLINETDKEGRTPLQLCAIVNRPEEEIKQMKLILLKYATPEVQMSTLTSLIDTGNRLGLTEFLVALPELKLSGLEKKTQLSALSLIVSTDESDPASMNSARLLLERADDSLLKATNDEGETPFIQILKQRKMGLAALMPNGRLIQWAIDNDDQKLAGDLVEQGREAISQQRIEVISQQCIEKHSPLLYAATQSKQGMMQVLLEKGFPVTNDPFLGGNILHWTATSASAELLQLMLESGGKSFVNEENKEGKTPLELLPDFKGNAKILMLNGALIRPEKYLVHPLYDPIKDGDVELFEFLLQHAHPDLLRSEIHGISIDMTVELAQNATEELQKVWKKYQPN